MLDTSIEIPSLWTGLVEAVPEGLSDNQASLLAHKRPIIDIFNDYLASTKVYLISFIESSFAHST